MKYHKIIYIHLQNKSNNLKYFKTLYLMHLGNKEGASVDILCA